MWRAFLVGGVSSNPPNLCYFEPTIPDFALIQKLDCTRVRIQQVRVHFLCFFLTSIRIRTCARARIRNFWEWRSEISSFRRSLQLVNRIYEHWSTTSASATKVAPSAAVITIRLDGAKIYLLRILYFFLVVAFFFSFYLPSNLPDSGTNPIKKITLNIFSVTWIKIAKRIEQM